MANLRSKSKSSTVAPRTVQKTAPMPPTASDPSNLNEPALRKLSRAELQKLAMANKIKANIKSELIIRQLLRVQSAKGERQADDDPGEGPSRKRLKREATLQQVSKSSPPDHQAAPTDTRRTIKTPTQRSVKAPQTPPAGPSAPRLTTYRALTPVPHNNSPIGPEAAEEEQLDFATPVSSRTGTPPPATVRDLKRCVTIMQQIATKDAALLNEVADMRETAAKLRRRASDVRELVKAERGRRERMEAYFRYWQEMDPKWDRAWISSQKEQKCDIAGYIRCDAAARGNS